jgi:hypothetical protein
MKTQITNYIKAGYPGIYIVSHEEARVEAELKGIAEDLNYRLHAWSVTDGLIDTSDGTIVDAGDPMACMEQIGELPDNAMVLLRDFHQFVEDSNPMITRAVKDQLRAGKTRGIVLIVVACRSALPPELERELVVIDFALPDKEELATVMDHIADSADVTKPEGGVRDCILDSACGLTSTEAENAFALSVAECGELSPTLVARQKANEVAKGGLLEVRSNEDTLGNVGGLDLLKAWLDQRKGAFGKEAEDYGLPMPRGLLIVGIPGTGKSLTAKATAAVFGRPLLRLDVGRLFAGVVGQTESNLRSVIATVEAIAPCVLWIDEIEKGFSGAGGSGVTDGGTSSRMFGCFLSWMQDRTSPVFVVATANDVSQLPPEFLRKGRFDELFFVDLPNSKEREAIWRIQIEKYGREPDTFELRQLVAQTKGFTGAEIEQAFKDSLFRGFADGHEPNDLLVMTAIGEQTPLSRLMKEEIAALRKWAKSRTRPASETQSEDASRKILAGN